MTTKPTESSTGSCGPWEPTAEPDLETLAQEGYEKWQRDLPSLIAVDTETTGFEFFDAPFCVTIAWGNSGGEISSGYFECGVADSLISEILGTTPCCVFHNAKFDLQKLVLAGFLPRDHIQVRGFEDTQILSYLTDEHRRHGLKPLTRMFLGEETDEEEVLKVVRRKLKLRKDDGYHLLPREVIVPYAIKDAEYTYRLFPVLFRQLSERNDPELLGLYEMEKELTLVLLDMERAGVAVDLEYAVEAAKDYGTKAIATEMRIRDLTEDEEFNPQSNPQIREAFIARGIERDKYDKAVLSELDDPLAEAILSLRSIKKLHGTYLLPLLREQRDGVLHPNFRQTQTKTGRLASGGMEAV